jgi:hypothetical protein
MFWKENMRRLNWLLVPVALLCLAGCGEGGPERIGLSGHVTYNDVPIEDGEIAFYPDKGTETPPTSTRIIHGSYKLNDKWAIVPGTYTVSVLSYKVPEKPSTPPVDSITNPQASVGIVIKDQLLPEKFNTKSTIEKLTVSSGEAPVERDYDLKD